MHKTDLKPYCACCAFTFIFGIAMWEVLSNRMVAKEVKECQVRPRLLFITSHGESRGSAQQGKIRSDDIVIIIMYQHCFRFQYIFSPIDLLPPVSMGSPVSNCSILFATFEEDQGFADILPLLLFQVSCVYRKQLVETARLLPVVWELHHYEQAQQVQGPELGLAHRGRQQLELSAQEEQPAAVLAEVVLPAADDSW